MSDESKFEKAISFMSEQRQKYGVDIDGKLYSMVKDRVEVFRKLFGSEYGIVTDVDYNNLHATATNSYVVAHAMIVTRDSGVTLASGHAMVWVGQDAFTANAPIEVAETSAIGRALAAFGLHGGEYASSNEVHKAKANQSTDYPENRQRQEKHVEEVADTRRQQFVKDVQDKYPGAVEVGPTTGLYLPRNNSPEELDNMFRDIDAILDLGLLSSYYNELERQFDTFPREVVADINAAFKARGKQIRSN